MGRSASSAPWDLVIIIAYGVMTDEEARAFTPRVVFVDSDNKQVELGEHSDDPAYVPENFGLVSPRGLV